MSCATVRQRLLASERPDQPGPDEASHLANCPACQAWQLRLVGLEQAIPRIPLPACPPPAALMARILDQAPASPAPAPTPRKARPSAIVLVRPPAPRETPPRVRAREGGRQKLALAFSLAASLALFAFGWWAWPSKPPLPLPGPAPAIDPYVAKRDEMLRPARTPEERVQAMARMAEQFLAEARTREDEPERVATLAGYFTRLMRSDLLRCAQDVPLASRANVLEEVALRLGRTESEASRLASEWSHRKLPSVDSLRQIAASAREADRQLRLLVQASRA